MKTIKQIQMEIVKLKEELEFETRPEYVISTREMIEFREKMIKERSFPNSIWKWMYKFGKE